MDVTFTVYQRVTLTRGRESISGRIIAIDPYKRHPYLVHLDDDSYTRANGEQLEREAEK